MYIYIYIRTPIIRINWDDEPSGKTENPVIGFLGYIVSLKFGCYYLQNVPASKPFNYTWLEVLETKTLYCTWSDNP
jgi:hypothetical protein